MIISVWREKLHKTTEEMIVRSEYGYLLDLKSSWLNNNFSSPHSHKKQYVFRNAVIVSKIYVKADQT